MEDRSGGLRTVLWTLALSLALAGCGGEDGTGGGLIGGGDGSATLTWQAPVTNEDDSCIEDLAGYRVIYGLAPEALNRSEMAFESSVSCEVVGQDQSCGDIRQCSYTVDGLESASWYFAVVAVDEYGYGSRPSEVALKTID